MASSLALWCLFLLASSPVAFTIFSGSPPDSAPLLRFKAQISRDPTGILISWTNLTNPCQWTGVSCNSVNRVVALQLHNARLAGYLPVPVIASLSMLQNLDLSQNAFLGNLSGLVERSGSCRDLKTVNLGDNALSGQIPAELLSCGLQELVLSGNNFTGNVPTVRFSGDLQVLDLSRNRLLGPITDFKGCRGLITVDLSSNALSGGIPSFQDCTALQMLNLSGNPLGGYLPEFLGNLHSLRRLYLSNNQIKGPIINKLAGICDTLEELDLSVNNLTGTIPPSLAACSHLQKLNLAENNLFGDFPTQVLSKLSSLESLVLSFNSFDGSYPIGLTSCTSLKILDLSSNKLSGSLPHEICPPGFAIEKLYLPNNEFSGSIPVAFSNCTQLKVLDLSFNNLIGPIPPDLGLMPNLETLSLWFNALTGNIPSELGQLSKLKSLVLNHNYLSGKIPAELTNCSVLQWVSLTSNLLTGSIPPEIGNMKTLSLLMLANNSLSGILPSELGNCSNLLWLDLNTNGLTGPIPPRLGRLASGPPETRTVEGISFAFVRNLASSCKGIGIGTLIEIHGIPESALWKRSLSQLCKSTRLYKGDSLNDNPDFGTIQVIDLSYNQLEGNIPPEMGHFHALTMLDLAHNKLTGTIPPTFSLLRNLGVLDLSNNNLEGNLSPLGSCSFLVQIDVSNNNFSGQIPSTGQLSTAPASGYANNPNLCGEPLPHCGWPSPNGSSQQPTSCHGSCMHNGLAVLSWANSVMLGILICIVCICALIAWIMLKRVRNKKKDCDLLTSLQSSRNGTSSSWNLSGEKEPLSINVATFERPLRKLTFSQLIEATNGFSPESLIGSGGFGEVYKAELRDGSVVAIKKLLQFSFQGNREFVAEMETLGKIKHRNLVPLLGYCKVGEERLLVYEYMHGGSLDEVLHGTRKGTETLSWDQRKQIAKGAARGLAFLHHNCIPHIIHRDMKSSNVLLDKDMEARVSDFGMARLINALDTHLSVSTLAGTPGYVPPEYYQSFRCTTKGDVYSFGVVLLELLTGKRPTDKEEFEDSNLIGWVKKHVNENRSMEVLDSQLRGTGVEHEMLQYLKIACQSLEDHPAARPNMLQVVAMLKELVLEED